MSVGWIVAVTALWAVVLGVLILLLGFLKRALPVLERAEQLLAPIYRDAAHDVLGDLKPGDVLPESVLDGAETKLPAVLLFVTDDCDMCGDLIAEIARGGPPDSVHLTVIADKALPEQQAEGLASAGATTFVRNHHDAHGHLHTANLPLAYAVDQTRVVVGRAAPASHGDLQELAARMANNMLPST